MFYSVLYLIVLLICKFGPLTREACQFWEHIIKHTENYTYLLCLRTDDSL